MEAQIGFLLKIVNFFELYDRIVTIYIYMCDILLKNNTSIKVLCDIISE